MPTFQGIGEWRVIADTPEIMKIVSIIAITVIPMIHSSLEMANNVINIQIQ